MRRGEVWTLPDGRDVLIVSLTGLEEAYGAVLAIVLHPAGRYPDTAMSVVLDDPDPATAVAIDLQQLRSARFEGGTCRGQVPAETMARVDQALRAVLDLEPHPRPRPCQQRRPGASPARSPAAGCFCLCPTSARRGLRGVAA
ncbi:hypothetical protein [Streptomyces mexicanus]|uniref:hypothetical protein n=1 Tax=Streptomyces mexicanus TaxID=178566 RepID=UPI00364C9F9C